MAKVTESAELNRLIEIDKADKGKKPFNCNACVKAFNKKQPFNCNICDEAFKGKKS
jgi:hypothetical protein